MAIARLAKSLKIRIIPRRFRSKSAGDSPSTSPTPPPATKEEEFREVFKFLDANNDGKISAEELKDYFTSVGEPMTHEEAEKIIGEFSSCTDSDSMMLLGFEEFARMMEVRDSDEDDDKILRRAFEVYEVEKGCGCITPEGLRQVLGRLGEEKTVSECRAMIRVFDLDGNGVLDFNEFQKMMV